MSGVRPVWQDAMGRILEEHADLHQATRQFLEQARREAPVAELVSLLQDLIRKLALHFEGEEQVMRRSGYPEAHAHHLLHEACLRQFRAQLEQLTLGQPLPFESHQDLIRTWVIDHMRLQDRRFDAYLASQDSTPPAGNPPARSRHS